MILFAISAVGLLLLVYLGVCLFYWWFQERFLFVRFTLADDFKFSDKQVHEELWMDTPDGARLHALHFPQAGATGVVLYMHGNTGSLRRWQGKASRFTSLGLSVLMPDYRGYGKSRGKLSEEALLADAAAWYDRLAAIYGEVNIVVYGRSMGSGMAVPVAAHRSPRALLLESPYADLLDVARNYLAILPYRWLLKYRFRNDVAIKRVKCPVYIFHGKRDPLVPYSSGLKLYAATPTDIHRELISFEKGYHSNLPGFPRFRRKLRAILTQENSVNDRDR
ncbi:MAG: alpha/beta hydrolase [Flavobacteriales bacterium]|nr:alpha/beta hydrolase [Flavobacteriales bacterium]